MAREYTWMEIGINSRAESTHGIHEYWFGEGRAIIKNFYRPAAGTLRQGRIMGGLSGSPTQPTQRRTVP